MAKSISEISVEDNFETESIDGVCAPFDKIRPNTVTLIGGEVDNFIIALAGAMNISADAEVMFVTDELLNSLKQRYIDGGHKGIFNVTQQHLVKPGTAAGDLTADVIEYGADAIVIRNVAALDDGKYGNGHLTAKSAPTALGLLKAHAPVIGAVPAWMTALKKSEGASVTRLKDAADVVMNIAELTPASWEIDVVTNRTGEIGTWHVNFDDGVLSSEQVKKKKKVTIHTTSPKPKVKNLDRPTSVGEIIRAANIDAGSDEAQANIATMVAGMSETNAVQSGQLTVNTDGSDDDDDNTITSLSELLELAEPADENEEFASTEDELASLIAEQEADVDEALDCNYGPVVDFDDEPVFDDPEDDLMSELDELGDDM